MGFYKLEHEIGTGGSPEKIIENRRKQLYNKNRNLTEG